MTTRRGGTFCDSLAQDLKYAVRTLGRNKGYTAVAILTLALGIGGAITAFVIGDRVLLRPLPYPAANKLLSVIQADGLAGGLPVNVRHFAALRTALRSFKSLDAAIVSERNLHVGDAIEPVQAASVSGGFFNTTGVNPVVGRTIGPDDVVRAAPAVAVLSHSLWRRSFGADPSVVGRTITLSNTPYTVIGIMPAWYSVPERTAVWLPCNWCERPPAGITTAEVIGRLDGASIDEARAELAVLWARLHEKAPPQVRDTMGRVTAVPLQETVVGGAAKRIQMLAAGMGLLLLIGCANLASATMARNVTRLRELALRSALGAVRRRIVQQLAIESLLVSTIASLAGLGLAAALLRVVARFGATHFPHLQELAIDARTIGFAAVLAAVVALLIGVLPAMQAARRDLASHLAGYAARRTRGPRTRAARVLLTAEIAMCLVVVAAAGLAARSLHLVYQQPIGIDTGGLATIRPQLDFRRYRTAESMIDLYDRVQARIAALPGVQSVGAAATVPLGEAWIGLIEIEGRPELKQPIAGYNLVTEGFFQTVGVPLRRGRLLTTTDDNTSEPVTVINQAMANRYWPGQDPIGQRFRAVSFDRGGPPVWFRIVGIVADMRTLSMEIGYQPIHYVNARQQVAMLGRNTIIARGSGTASALLPGLRAALREVDPQAGGITTTVDEMVQEVTLERRQAAGVLAGFAALAVILAGIGIYGVLAYSVAQRLREIGIRMALGASAGRVVRQTLGDLGVPVVTGIIAGLLAARAASGVFTALVFGIKPTDPFVLGSAAAVIVTLSLFAAYVPARRAARVDPTLSLRAD